MAAEAGELRPDDRVMRIKQGAPVTVADLRGPARRVHDVGEQHGGKNPVVGHLGPVPREEFGDLLEGVLPWFNEVI